MVCGYTEGLAEINHACSHYIWGFCVGTFQLNCWYIAIIMKFYLSMAHYNFSSCYMIAISFLAFCVRRGWPARLVSDSEEPSTKEIPREREASSNSTSAHPIVHFYATPSVVPYRDHLVESLTVTLVSNSLSVGVLYLEPI